MVKSVKRDIILLSKILDNQNEINQTLKTSYIYNETSFAKQPLVIQRGLVALTADIFELTRALRDETIKDIGINIGIIKDFRNTSTHNYGELSPEFAFACIKHCTSKDIVKNISNEIKSLLGERNQSKENNQEDNNKNEGTKVRAKSSELEL